MANLESDESSLPSASTSGEPTQDQKAVAKKRPSIWNPFQGLETEGDALTAAKVGVVVAGIIAVEHVVFGLSVLVSGLADTRSATVGNIIAIVLMAFLGWWIFKEQRLWASVALLAWATLEIVAKIVFMLGPNASRGLPGGLIIDVIVLAGALLSVRGCLKLKRLGHAEKPKVI